MKLILSLLSLPDALYKNKQFSSTNYISLIFLDERNIIHFSKNKSKTFIMFPCNHPLSDKNFRMTLLNLFKRIRQSA